MDRSAARKKCLVMIPAYNESGAIENTVNALLSRAGDIGADLSYVIINDGSTDNTAEICLENGFELLCLPINLGIGGTVQMGYRYALANDFDIAVQMDGDGQHDPAYLGKLIAPILNGEADFTIGSRFYGIDSFRTSFMRRAGIRVIAFFIWLCTGQWFTDTTSGFRAVGKKGIKLFSMRYARDYPEPESIVRAINNGLKVKDVAVSMNERTTGTSSINTLKSAYYMIKMVFAVIFARLEKKYMD